MTELAYPVAGFQQMAQNPALASLWVKAPDLLQQSQWPRCEDWQRILDADTSWQELPKPLQFVPEIKLGQRRKRKLAQLKNDPQQPALRRYESAIIESQQVPMREQNLHDYFNALIWLQFPKAKYALHQSAYRSYQTGQCLRQGNLRNDLTDALTRFDEGGLVYFAQEGEPIAAIRAIFRDRDDQAKLLFASAAKSKFEVFGHGLLEVWSRGERGLTAGILIVEDSKQRTRDENLAAYLHAMQEPFGNFGTFILDGLLAISH